MPKDVEARAIMGPRSSNLGPFGKVEWPRFEYSCGSNPLTQQSRSFVPLQQKATRKFCVLSPVMALAGDNRFGPWILT